MADDVVDRAIGVDQAIIRSWVMAFFILHCHTRYRGRSRGSVTGSSRPLGVAILGFGTVGRSVARIVCDGSHPSLRLTHVLNREVKRKRVDVEWMPSGVVWTDDIDTVLASDADIVVELIGGVDPAAGWIRRALEAGKSVVTANKQVIAHHGPELLPVAAEHGRHLCFEAAVAGGIPIISGVREGLAGDSLVRVLGILNGTCNYILTRMEADHVSFEAALKEAQDLGFAEADPTADVDGYDAQAKLAILSAVALGRQVPVDDVPLRTITTIEPVDFVYSRRLGCTIRQVAWAELEPEGDRVRASVQPTLVPVSSALARVEGSRNVVVVEGRFGGETVFFWVRCGWRPDGRGCRLGPRVNRPKQRPGGERGSEPQVGGRREGVRGAHTMCGSWSRTDRGLSPHWRMSSLVTASTSTRCCRSRDGQRQSCRSSSRWRRVGQQPSRKRCRSPRDSILMFARRCGCPCWCPETLVNDLFHWFAVLDVWRPVPG